jgi:(2Fe-2S) ferredoxin
MQEIDFPKPKLHFFICVNERPEDHPTPSCGPRIKPEDVKEVKLWIREQGWTGVVQCTKASCLGFCNKESSVACVYPAGKFVKGIQTVDDVKEFINGEMDKL